MTRSSADVSRILRAIRDGDGDAENELFEVVYDELRGMARARMRRESPGGTLQTTALVNEAYLRLVSDDNRRWQNRAYFFGAAAEAMRRILIDRARKRGAVKHGGDRVRVPLEENIRSIEEASPDLIALDGALGRLEEKDARKSQVVKLHYLLGLTVPETAEILGIAPRTVDKDWQFAKAWLKREMTGTGST